MERDARTDATLETDRQLVEAARRGSQPAFRSLLERHQKRAFKVALGVVRDGDDAREVCQEAFLRVHKNLAAFDDRAQFTTWLHRIVVNLSIDFLRRRRTVRLDADAAMAIDENAEPVMAQPLDFDPERRCAARELGEQLKRALAVLTPAHRTILILREVEDLSYEEIAQTLSIPIGTVMSRLFHARKHMQRLLVAHQAHEPEILRRAA